MHYNAMHYDACGHPVDNFYALLWCISIGLYKWSLMCIQSCIQSRPAKAMQEPCQPMKTPGEGVDCVSLFWWSL